MAMKTGPMLGVDIWSISAILAPVHTQPTEANMGATMQNTGVMCMVMATDPNREGGFRLVDIGNYFITGGGRRCVVTSRAMAERFYEQIHDDIFVRDTDCGYRRAIR